MEEYLLKYYYNCKQANVVKIIFDCIVWDTFNIPFTKKEITCSLTTLTCVRIERETRISEVILKVNLIGIHV
jgi:hypothetical protein